MYKKIAKILLTISCVLQYTFISLAAPTSITDSKFASMDADKVPSLILGTVIWLLRIVGVLVLMSGIYKVLVARKSGEAEDINMAMIKLVIGACFIAFPGILKAIGVIA